MMPEFFGTRSVVHQKPVRLTSLSGPCCGEGKWRVLQPYWMPLTYGYGNRLRVRQNWIRMSASAV